MLRIGLGARFRGFGEYVGIVRSQRRRTREGIARFDELALFGKRAAEQAPAIGLRRIALHFLLQARNRIVDGLRRFAQRWIERGWRAEQGVQADGTAEDEHGQRDGEAALRAPQRRQHQREDGEREQGGEGDEYGHHHSWVSSFASVVRERRRTMANTSAPPATSTSAGPNHSSQVLASTRGLYSTNSP